MKTRSRISLATDTPNEAPPGTLWKIRLLGELRAEQEGRVVARYQTQKVAALLAYLAFFRDRLHPRELLTDHLWPEVEPEAGRNSLSQCIFRLRVLLEPTDAVRGSVILSSKFGVRLNPAAFTTDVEEFEAALRSAHASKDFGERSQWLEQAVGIYRGELLPGYYEEWILAEQQRLSESYLRALHQLVSNLAEGGELGKALPYARLAVGADPENEESHRTLMRLHASVGETTAALRHYDRMERLQAEVGAEPSAAIRRLAEEIREQGRSGVGEIEGGEEGQEKGVVPHNLPEPATRFIGREKELEDVKRLLGATRLLTLTGSGGCGKTRLSLQIAADQLGGYPDGVWLVELASLSDPTLVPQAVAFSLGIREGPETSLTQTLVSAMKRKRLLLLLDNCEHLVQACATLVETVTQACPGVRILATSREGLNIPGEVPYRLQPLSTPDPWEPPATMEGLNRYEAPTLFLDRVRTVAPSLVMSEEKAPAVAQICYQLDGIPLAIELAAVRVKALSVETIAERLDDRFRLLTGGSRTALPRHQTLRALIDWSYDLLAKPEQILLCRLSVFAGRWSLEAAEAVCVGEGTEGAAILDLLAALVEKSLVVYEERDKEPQYRLLETIRQYAYDRLQKTEGMANVCGRHRDWFLALAEQAASELRGPRQRDWLERLESEHDNLRLALEWCRAEETGAEAELRLAKALVWFWIKRSYLSEGRQGLEGALSRSSGTPSPLRMEALLGAGRLAALTGDYERSDSLIQEGLGLARSTGDSGGIAMALSLLVFPALAANEGERAAGLAEESLAKAREAGDPWLIAFCLHLIGNVARRRGDLERAVTLFRESLALIRPVGDEWMITLLMLNLGGGAQGQGDYESAELAYQECLTMSQDQKDRRGMAWCFECLAEVAAARNCPQRGARLMGAAEGLLDSIGASWPPNYLAGRDRTVAACRAALGDVASEAARAEGRAMMMEQAVTYALDSNRED